MYQGESDTLIVQPKFDKFDLERKNKDDEAKNLALGTDLANILKNEEFILALKTDNQLIVG